MQVLALKEGRNKGFKIEMFGTNHVRTFSKKGKRYEPYPRIFCSIRERARPMRPKPWVEIIGENASHQAIPN